MTDEDLILVLGVASAALTMLLLWVVMLYIDTNTRLDIETHFHNSAKKRIDELQQQVWDLSGKLSIVECEFNSLKSTVRKFKQDTDFLVPGKVSVKY